MNLELLTSYPSYPTPLTIVRVERMNDTFIKFHLDDTRVLHHFTAANDAEYHDHPYPFRTSILSGGYVEEIAQVGSEGRLITTRIERRQGTTHRVESGTIHKLVGLLGTDCWTLIEPGEKQREPGFYRADAAGVWHRFWYETDWKLFVPVDRPDVHGKLDCTAQH